MKIRKSFNSRLREEATLSNVGTISRNNYGFNSRLREEATNPIVVRCRKQRFQLTPP